LPSRSLAVPRRAICARSLRRQTLCVPRRWIGRLRAFKMQTDLKRRIDRDLPAIFEDVSRLNTYGTGIKDAHIAALTNVIQQVKN
jgi:hypothetical protein